MCPATWSMAPLWITKVPITHPDPSRSANKAPSISQGWWATTHFLKWSCDESWMDWCLESSGSWSTACWNTLSYIRWTHSKPLITQLRIVLDNGICMINSFRSLRIHMFWKIEQHWTMTVCINIWDFPRAIERFLRQISAQQNHTE